MRLGFLGFKLTRDQRILSDSIIPQKRTENSPGVVFLISVLDRAEAKGEPGCRQHQILHRKGCHCERTRKKLACGCVYQKLPSLSDFACATTNQICCLSSHWSTFAERPSDSCRSESADAMRYDEPKYVRYILPENLVDLPLVRLSTIKMQTLPVRKSGRIACF